MQEAETLQLPAGHLRSQEHATNGYVERFHWTLLDEFFLITIRKNVYSSLVQIQDDLDRFMVGYNFKRTHQGIKLGGIALIRKFLSGIKIPLMIESKN